MASAFFLRDIGVLLLYAYISRRPLLTWTWSGKAGGAKIPCSKCWSSRTRDSELGTDTRMTGHSGHGAIPDDRENAGNRPYSVGAPRKCYNSSPTKLLFSNVRLLASQGVTTVTETL